MTAVTGVAPTRPKARGGFAPNTFGPMIVVVVAACLVGVAVPRLPAPLLVAGLAALVVMGCIALHPPLGAYILLGGTPLIAGIDRGAVIPFFRPSEALALLVAGGLFVRGMIRFQEHGIPKLVLRRTDITILLLAVTSSIVPILWMLIRGVHVESDDILYALVIWKYYALYLIVRCCVHKSVEVRRGLYISLGAAAVVAVIGILQALHLFGITEFLQRYYTSYGVEDAVLNHRGGSTLSLPIAAADLALFNLAIGFGLFVRHASRAERRYVIVTSILCLGGVLAAGEFSGIIGLAVMGITLAWVTQHGRQLVKLLPIVLVVGWFMRPVLAHRLADIDPQRGLPVSWVGRLNNLHTFFWPKLFAGNNIILGIRPAARVATTKYASGWVWIESGYTWLLWGGGIPLLCAFLYFVYVAFRENIPRARERSDAIGAAALGVVGAMAVIAVCMMLDPHLTYRGSADLLFALLALAGVRAVDLPPPQDNGLPAMPRPLEAIHGSEQS